MKTRLLPLFALLALVACAAALVPTAAAAPPAARSAAAGPALSIAPDQRHVLDRDGNAVFFHAEAAWHLIPRLTRAEATAYLDDRRAKGFNALLLSLVVTDGYPNGPGSSRGGEPPFRVPEDFSTPNEVYFAQADWVLHEAQARGMTAFVCPAYLGYECGAEGWCAAMKRNGRQVMRDFGRWVGRRYRDFPNLVWVNGGDADAAAQGVAALVDAVAEGIREVDPNHLHTGHCSRMHSGTDCYDRPWLDLNTTYADCTHSAQALRTDLQRPLPRPFLYIEGRYEFENDATDRCLRGQAYWSLLGGASGHFFGSGRIWDFPKGWRRGLDSAGSRSMQHFGRLLRSRRWDLLAPDTDGTVLVQGAGALDSSDFAAAARTADGQTVLVYAPTRRTMTVDLGQIRGNAAAGWWFNPANGKAKALGSFPTQGTRAFTPPSAADWVLVLDDAAAGLGPPGQP